MVVVVLYVPSVSGDGSEGQIFFHSAVCRFESMYSTCGRLSLYVCIYVYLSPPLLSCVHVYVRGYVRVPLCVCVCVCVSK